MSHLKKVLKQRGKSYGDYKKIAKMTAKALKALKVNDKTRQTHPAEWFALVMIINKISRLTNTHNLGHLDSWVDIAGYASLISDELKKGVKNGNSTTKATKQI